MTLQSSNGRATLPRPSRLASSNRNPRQLVAANDALQLLPAARPIGVQLPGRLGLPVRPQVRLLGVVLVANCPHLGRRHVAGKAAVPLPPAQRVVPLQRSLLGLVQRVPGGAKRQQGAGVRVSECGVWNCGSALMMQVVVLVASALTTDDQNHLKVAPYKNTTQEHHHKPG